MKKYFNVLLFSVLLSLTAFDAYSQSGIYACGHIRRQRLTAIENLRNSGYTNVILFNVNVEVDGSLTTDYAWSSQTAAEAGGIICQNGEYVFSRYQPEYISDIRRIVEAPTAVKRLEICIGGWGNGSYGNVKRLVEQYGTGPETVLYRNFKALKEALPEIEAVNNDQEQDYDLNSCVAFHRMLADIGYKTSIAPYMNKEYWRQLVAELNKSEETCDLVYLQTYGGGAYNNPADWMVFGGLPMYVGFDCEANRNINDMISKFKNWESIDGVTGGFLWNYNSEDLNQNEWATNIDRIFFHPDLSDVGATVYTNARYRGDAYRLPVGAFSQSELSLYGVLVSTISSVEIPEGYKLTLYKNADLTGESKEYKVSVASTGSGWKSLKIEKDDSGISASTLSDKGFYISGDEVTLPAGITEFQLVDINGTVVAKDKLRGSTCGNTVSLKELPKGIYILTTCSGSFKIVKR